MKARQGFVSNSSSSSFYIRGKVNRDHVEAFVKTALDFYNEIRKGKHEPKRLQDVCSVHVITDSEKKFVRRNYPGVKVDKFTVSVDSVDDNSMPHFLFEVLSEKYDGQYFHWG